SDNKIGITINRRYGKAHERNKAKRRLRAICGRSLPSFKGGVCMAFKITDEFKIMTFVEAGDAFEQMMKKAGVLE
ncbi:MAG: ribonuclease P protein component, partial [Spirochaetota bacterium]